MSVADRFSARANLLTHFTKNGEVCFLLAWFDRGGYRLFGLNVKLFPHAHCCPASLQTAKTAWLKSGV